MDNEPYNLINAAHQQLGVPFLEVKSDCHIDSMISRFFEAWKQWGISPDQQIAWIHEIFGKDVLKHWYFPPEI